MRNLFCLSFFLCINVIISAQSYIGFGADNFNGVHGVLFNPANIADSRLKVDVNLASVSAFTTNTYYEINYLKSIFGQDVVDLEEVSNKVGVDKITNGILNADVLGPSVMITWNEKHAFALSTRFRSMANINVLDGELLNFFQTENLGTLDYRFIGDINSSGIFNNWLEFGGSYAHVLDMGRKDHFLKVGATLKLLSGQAYMRTEANDALLLYNSLADDVANRDIVFFEGDANYSFSGNLDENENFVPFENDDDSEFFEGQTLGLGMDLGLVYEYRPKFRENVSRDHVQEQFVDRNLTTYVLKAGFSILDIGAMTYSNTRVTTSNLNDININQLFSSDFENETQEGLVISRFLGEQRLTLPARMRFDVDAKLKKKLYLNLNSNLSLVSKNNKNANRYVNSVTLSPRYETRWLTVQSPISYLQYGGLTWGIGTRIGPLFVGSGSILSNLLITESKPFDLYAGVKVPIFHKRPKMEEEDPTDSFESNCKGCLEETKTKKVRFDGYKGGRK